MIYRFLNINELNIEDISGRVSKERLNRAEKFKNEIDKKRSIAVEYLLNEMLDELYDGITPVELSYDKNGKPHIYEDASEGGLEGTDLVQFSLSHSGDYVACIISDVPCGIDIERHSERRDYEKIAKRICTDRELVNITNREDFYQLWTLKESVMKAVGLGLALDMRKIEIERVNERYEIMTEGKKYIGHVLKAPDGYSLSYVEKITRTIY